MSMNETMSNKINMDTNEKTILFLCLDPNNEIEELKTSDLNQINEDFIFYHQSEACLSFIQERKNQKIFLIIPFSQMTSFVINHHQIECIFIFSFNHDQLLYQNPKVIGIYDQTETLFFSIQEQVNFLERQNRIWCLFDQNEFRNKNLSDLASDFLWFELFHEFLMNLPIEQQIKKQKIEISSTDSQYNFEENSMMNQLKTKDETEDALQYFLNNPSLQKMINKALQTRNINLLYDIRYFLANLLYDLKYECKKMIENNRKKLITYRTMELSSDELKQLKQSQGQLILMKGFLTAYSQQSLCLEQINSKSVLFQIEYDLKELGDNLVVASVTQFSELSSHESILFDFNATFRLESVTQNNQIWMIKLNAVNEGKSILKKYIDDTHRQREDLSISIMFGQLLCDTCEWNQSQRYFKRLRNDLPDEDSAWIEYSIGQTYHWLGKWDEARKYYDRAYNRMMQNEPSRIKDSAFILIDIGNILCSQGKYDESLEFYERALIIRKQYYPSNHIHVAISLKNIAYVKFQHQKDNEALDLYREALAILNEYYDHFHFDIAIILSSIGNVLANQENYDEGLSYHQQALSMCKVYNPSGHVYISFILNRISFILRRQEKYQEAYRYAKEALKIQKRFYPNGHIYIVNSLYTIGRMKNRQNEYDVSSELGEKILEIKQKYYFSGHLDIIYTLNILGYTYLYRKQNCDQSLHYYQQALHLLEAHYPSYHGHIAMALNYIGNVLRKQKKYIEALDFYYRALQTQENYYLSDHTDMPTVLNNIAKILIEQGNHEEALAYLQRALSIREKYHSPHHINIAFSLQMIGEVKLKQHKFNDAFEYLQKALVIFEQYHGTYFNEIHICLETIGDVFWLQLRYDRSQEYLKRCLSISERCFPSEYSKTIRLLFNLGLSYRIQHQYELALVYEIKCLSIQEEFLSPNHQEIGESLKNIGLCYYELHQPKLALEYYKRSFNVYKQCLPSEHLERKNVEAMIRKVCDELQLVNI